MSTALKSNYLSYQMIILENIPIFSKIAGRRFYCILKIKLAYIRFLTNYKHLQLTGN